MKILKIIVDEELPKSCNDCGIDNCEPYYNALKKQKMLPVEYRHEDCPLELAPQPQKEGIDKQEGEEYGTPITAEELMQHYKYHKMKPTEFKQLIIEYKNQTK